MADHEHWVMDLQEENKKLREALEPFAFYGQAISGKIPDSFPMTVTIDFDPPKRVTSSGMTLYDITLTAVAFRNAQEALKSND